MRLAPCIALCIAICLTGCGGSSGNSGDSPDAFVPPPPMATCDEPFAPVDTSTATVISDCSSPAPLVAAVAQGGVIRFDCGPDPVTITLDATIVVPNDRDVVIDGGNKVTLSGGDRVRHFLIDHSFELAGPKLTLQHLRLVQGRTSGTDIANGGASVHLLGGSLDVYDCTFVDNHGPQDGQDTAGGAINAIGVGEVRVVASVLAGNSCSNGGAIGLLHSGLELVNSTLDGNQATGAGGNPGNGGNGGAISMDGENKTLSLCGSRITNNLGNAHGGAIFRTSYHGEPTVIVTSTIDGNSIPQHDPDPSHTGGVYLQGTFVTIWNSTISNNSARSFGGLFVVEHGGQAARLTMVNTTVSGNSCHEQSDFTMTAIGGGVVIGDNVDGSISNCTIAGNRSQFASGIANVSRLRVYNSIISNTALNEWTPLNCTGSSYDSPPGTGDHNLQWPADNAGGNDMPCTPGITRGDPLLGPLGDNGGPTATMVPAAGSPAIGAGDSCQGYDQRGNPRPGTGCTLGAVEVSP